MKEITILLYIKKNTRKEKSWSHKNFSYFIDLPIESLLIITSKKSGDYGIYINKLNDINDIGKED